jgi:hypothetical protein
MFGDQVVSIRKNSRAGPQRVIAFAGAMFAHALLLWGLYQTGWAPRQAHADQTIEITTFGTAGFQSEAGSALGNPEERLLDSIRQGTTQSSATNDQPFRTVSEIWGSPASGNAGSAVSGRGSDGSGRHGSPDALVSEPRRPKAGERQDCWVKPDRPIPVTAMLVMDGDGSVVARPKIASLSGSPEPVNSPASKLAMAALSGCAPFGVPTHAGYYRTVLVNFSRDALTVTEGAPFVVR